VVTCDIPCTWLRTVAPTILPVTLDEAKKHCEIDDDAQNAKVNAWVLAATAVAESVTNRGLMTQTWKLLLDDFADDISLPMAAPLQSVTSVKYYDTDGVQQTLATTVYRIDTDSEPGRVVLKPDQSWPSIQSGRGQAVEIIYVCGWTDGNVPDGIKHAVLLLVGSYSEHREAVTDVTPNVLPFGVSALLDPHAVYWRRPVR
jgi:uncharacterized phiE125 gp8 family phage protein